MEYLKYLSGKYCILAKIALLNLGMGKEKEKDKKLYIAFMNMKNKTYSKCVKFARLLSTFCWLSYSRCLSTVDRSSHHHHSLEVNCLNV